MIPASMPPKGHSQPPERNADMAARSGDASTAPRFEQVLQVRAEAQHSASATGPFNRAGSASPTALVPEAAQLAANSAVRPGAIVPARVFRFDALGLLHVRELAALHEPQSGGSKAGVLSDRVAGHGPWLAGKEDVVLPPGAAGSFVPQCDDNAAEFVPVSVVDFLAAFNAGLSVGKGVAVFAELPHVGAVDVLLELVPTSLGVHGAKQVPAQTSGGRGPSRGAATGSGMTPAGLRATSNSSAHFVDVTVLLAGADAASVAIEMSASGGDDASLVAQVRQLLARYGIVAGKIVIAGRTAWSEGQSGGEEPWR